MAGQREDMAHGEDRACQETRAPGEGMGLYIMA